jgi:hypothetical protein
MKNTMYICKPFVCKNKFFFFLFSFFLFFFFLNLECAQSMCKDRATKTNHGCGRVGNETNVETSLSQLVYIVVLGKIIFNCKTTTIKYKLAPYDTPPSGFRSLAGYHRYTSGPSI